MTAADATPESARIETTGRERAARAFWIAAVAAGLLILLAGALAVTWTIPFQEWDAYSSGTWAVLVAQGSSLFPPEVDPILRQRPVVYLGEGLIWRALGHVSMRAGRVYSLLYSILLVVATYLVGRSLGGSRRLALLAATLAAASPLVTEQVSSTLTDIPAAAFVWLAFLSARKATLGARAVWWWASAVLCALALLTKLTVAPLIAFLLVAAVLPGARRMSKGEVARAAAAFGTLAAATLLYFNDARDGVSWTNFAYGWAGPYYSHLAEPYRISNLREVQWFGVFVSGALVLALAASAARALRGRGPVASAMAWLVFVAGAVYVVVGSRGLTVPLRAFDAGSRDRWLASTPELAALVVVALLSGARRPTGRRPFGIELLLPCAPFVLIWWWKLGYDRRFLVVILPAVCVFVAGWLVESLDGSAPLRALAYAGTLLFLLAAGWEGTRRMDHAFPVFSKQMVELNRKDGPAPEAKLVDIFGESARTIERLQAMVRTEPGIRIVTPDNRLMFHLGRSVTIAYPTSEQDLAPFDIFVWVRNTGVLEQYAKKYGVPNPLERLGAGGRLTRLWETPEYDVYRIRRGGAQERPARDRGFGARQPGRDVQARSDRQPVSDSRVSLLWPTRALSAGPAR